MKEVKITAMVLIIILFITGCSNNKNKNKDEQKIMGRYVENTLTLPEEISKKSNIQFTKKNNLPYLYIFRENKSISAYRMGIDGIWTEDTPEWLKSVMVPSEVSYMDKVLEDNKGNQYLYYAEKINDNIKGNLLRSTNGRTHEVLKPEGWEEEKSGSYSAPVKAAVLADGTIAALLDSGILQFYNKDTLKIEKDISKSEYSESIFTVSDNSIILGQSDKGKITGISVYDEKDNFNMDSYPVSSGENLFTYLDINKNKDLIMCSQEGIQVLERETSLWQTVLDGTLTSLSMQNMWITGFVADNEGNYYVMLNSMDNGYSLMKYSYDKTVASVPSKTLTVFTMKDNRTLRQAAVVFQQEHPDVIVNITVAMTDDSNSDPLLKEDYIRALNTELLAGGGADILVLDDLPVDDFKEKGVLIDISDIIKPMFYKEELLQNIMNNYMIDNKVFYIPARFKVDLICSKLFGGEKLTTLDALAEHAKVNQDTTLFGTVTPEDFIKAFIPIITKNFLEGHSINRAKLITDLNKLKSIADSCNIVNEYDNDNYKSCIWDTNSRAQISIMSCSGFLDSILTIGLINYSNCNFFSFEKSFTPMVELGINRASINQELCKDFISIALSKKVQKNDFYDGFPVNQQALKINSQDDRLKNAASLELQNGDGSFSSVKFEPMKDEQINDLMKLCQEVSNPADKNSYTLLTLLKETRELFLGSLTAEETADNIIRELDIYLSE